MHLNPELPPLWLTVPVLHPRYPLAVTRYCCPPVGAPLVAYLQTLNLLPIELDLPPMKMGLPIEMLPLLYEVAAH